MSTEGVTRWRRKFTIEAVQVTRENFYAVGEWAGAAECWGLDAPLPEIRIGTVGTWKRAHLGDYVVKDRDGAFHIGRAHDFEADYEPAEQAHPASSPARTAAGESGPVQPGTEGEKRGSGGLSAAHLTFPPEEWEVVKRVAAALSGDLADWLCSRCRTIHPHKPGERFTAFCPDCRVPMSPTSANLREIQRLRDERNRLVSEHAAEQDAIHADLGKLLEATGLGDYARPISSHEVMLQCIAEVKRLRAVAEGLPSEPAP